MSQPSASAAGGSSSSVASEDIWNPAQYLLFDELRARPGMDMIQRVQHTLRTFHQDQSSIKRVVDLGCGTGKLALQLAEKFPHARIEGVDSSENMIVAAKEATEKVKDEEVRKRVSWKKAGFQEFTDSVGADLIFSNAALHWDHSHSTLFPHLLGQLRNPGGILAVQMPNNFREPSHVNMLKALKEGKFFTEERLAEVWSKQPDVSLEGQSYYYHLLRQAGARHIDAWQTEYLQPISSTTKYHPVLEWTKSTALAPILAALPSQAEKDRFQELYSALLEQSYPYFEGKSGRQVLFPFKRIFLIAVR